MCGFCSLLVLHRIISHDEKTLVLGICNRKYTLKTTYTSASGEYLYWYDWPLGNSWKTRIMAKGNLPYQKLQHTIKLQQSNCKVLTQSYKSKLLNTVSRNRSKKIWGINLWWFCYNDVDITGYLFRRKHLTSCKINLKGIKYLKVKRT